MNAVPILLIVIIMLLLYIILFVHGSNASSDKDKVIIQKGVKKDNNTSIVGKTKTLFPSQETQRKWKEANEKGVEKTSIFASESHRDDEIESMEEEDNNEFEPMIPQDEIDLQDVEQEDLSILLDEEIEVSDESLTAKEIRFMQRAIERNKVTEEELPSLQNTVTKLQGSDFLEKLKSHEQLQNKLSLELMQILSGNTETISNAITNDERLVDDWTSFL